MSVKRPADTRLPSLRSGGLASFVGILCVILGCLFLRSFAPAWVVFANDGPLGAMMAERGRLPENFMGSWSDLNGYGSRDPGALPNLTGGLLWVLGPLGFAKFYAPITLLFLGICAWFLCRQLGLGTLAAMLGGLAAALCSTFFGAACWGVGPQALCFGLNYLALAIVVSPYPLRSWIRYPLAGLAVGMGVMEAFDIGAIFSVVTAICVVAHGLVAGGNPLKNFLLGLGRVAVIGIFAALIAASALSSLIGTQIQGVAGTEQDQRTKAETLGLGHAMEFPQMRDVGHCCAGAVRIPDGHAGGRPVLGQRGARSGLGPLFRLGEAGSAAAWIHPVWRRRQLHRGSRDVGGSLGRAPITAQGEFRFLPRPTQVYLVLDRHGLRLALIELWPFRAVLSIRLCVALCLHDFAIRASSWRCWSGPGWSSLRTASMA